MPRGRKPKEKAPKIEPIEKSGAFRVIFDFENKQEVFSGNSVLECLNQFAAKYSQFKFIKGKTDIGVEKDGLKSSMFLFPIWTKRLLVNKTYREILNKRLTLALH